MIEPFTPILSSRLDGVGEYYFSSKLREIEQLRKQGQQSFVRHSRRGIKQCLV